MKCVTGERNLNLIKNSELRKFGILIGLVALIVGVYPLLRRGEDVNVVLATTGSIFLLLGCALPQALIYFYKLWMKLGHVLGKINSTIILSLIFYIVLLPIALLKKMFTKESDKFSFKTGAQTYWINREPIDPKVSIKQPF